MDEAAWHNILALKTNDDPGISPPSDESDPDIFEYHNILYQSATNRLDRPLIFAHLAQTLDGRIACQNGESKWIGNQANLIHAHRMRAICDCVMVGKQTWKNDQPQLNVRHVSGDDPVKVVIEGHSINRNTYAKTFTYYGSHEQSGSWESPVDLLEKLSDLGIKSIFLEGGGRTISYFLMNQMVDYLQLHISPMVIGSGIPTISLPEISSLDQAITFEKPRFIPIDDHIMFSGKVIYQ